MLQATWGQMVLDEDYLHFYLQFNVNFMFLFIEHVKKQHCTNDLMILRMTVILPHRKMLKLLNHLVCLWLLQSFCIYQSCSGRYGAVTEKSNRNMRYYTVNCVMCGLKQTRYRSCLSVFLHCIFLNLPEKPKLYI